MDKEYSNTEKELKDYKNAFYHVLLRNHPHCPHSCSVCELIDTLIAKDKYTYIINNDG